MENKRHFLVWGLFVAVILLVLWVIVEPLIWWTQQSEARLYVRLFLIMFAVSTFSTLRLYNSIVQNTRFSIKLREALIKFQQSISAIERSIKGSSAKLDSSRNDLETLRRTINENNKILEQLRDLIKRKY